jgi:hypothetical protein
MELLNPLSTHRAYALFLAKDSRRSDVLLLPTVDPRVFRTPETFLHFPGKVTIEVYHNGRRLMMSATGTPADGDYVVAESFPGSGYDEVWLVSLTPNVTSRLTGSYYTA